MPINLLCLEFALNVIQNWPWPLKIFIEKILELVDTNSSKYFYNFQVLFLALDTKCPIIYFVLVLTCCIVFQFKSSSSHIAIRMELNDKVVAWRDLARWYGITTLLFQNGWCIWSVIIYFQPIGARNVYCLITFLGWKTLNLTKKINLGWGDQHGLNQSVKN